MMTFTVKPSLTITQGHRDQSQWEQRRAEATPERRFYAPDSHSWRPGCCKQIVWFCASYQRLAAVLHVSVAGVVAPG
jgi:hypothetical protein